MLKGLIPISPNIAADDHIRGAPRPLDYKLNNQFPGPFPYDLQELYQTECRRYREGCI